MNDPTKEHPWTTAEEFRLAEDGVYQGTNETLWLKHNGDWSMWAWDENWCLNDAESPDEIAAHLIPSEDLLKSKRELTRALDVALHGEDGAAKQASLCDLVGPARDLRGKLKEAQAQNEKLRGLLGETSSEVSKLCVAARLQLTKDSTNLTATEVLIRQDQIEVFESMCRRATELLASYGEEGEE